MFLEGTYVNTKTTRLRERSRKGQRLRVIDPFRQWKPKRSSPGYVAMSGAPWIRDGPINRSVFDTYIEAQLAPTLAKGDVVILDNLAAHRSERAADCLKQHGGWFLSLPAYSPD